MDKPKHSVLIIDDQKINISELSKALRPDYKIFAVGNGRDALIAAETNLPDVILLDIMMADMDGYEIIAALKISEKTKDVPVIFITGLEDVASEEKGLALGAADYIRKPFSHAIVRQRVWNQIKILEMNDHLKASTEQLEAALETANAANDAKSAFLATMSHEIRTPMNSIIGFSELALGSNNTLQPKIRDYLHKIRSNANILLSIINDILDVSKIESGNLELENIPFNINELFSACLELTLPKAIDKGLSLTLSIEPPVKKVLLGDPLRLQQVFINLISNAVKFTHNGTVELRTETKDFTENIVTLGFEVEDSGIGMTPEQMERIFNPFIQGSIGTTRQYGGTGLGLSITKNIIEKMGGSLSVESTPGVGSKFSFELTFDTADITDDKIEHTVVFNENEKPIFDREFLLCEDNEMNQQVICEHLEWVGIKTVIAENGKIGVEMVKRRMQKNERQFDLILMDIHMPVMDGLEATEKIIELDIGIPIIALTANIMAHDREIYKRKGMSECIGKPFTRIGLWSCLIKFFTPVKMLPVHNTANEHRDTELRQKLLLNFIERNKNKAAEITEAINTGDLVLAHRLAHTLKSNAGQLGKTSLQQASEAIENALADGNNHVTPQQLTTFETELSAVLIELAPLYEELTKSADETLAEPINKEDAWELLHKVTPLLENCNVECMGFLDDLRRIPGSEELIKQINDIHFPQAIIVLTELKNKMKNDLK